MITLLTFCALYSIIGWIVRHFDSSKKGYDYNIFDNSPSVLTVILLVSSVVTVVLGIYLCIKYLP